MMAKANPSATRSVDRPAGQYAGFDVRQFCSKSETNPRMGVTEQGVTTKQARCLFIALSWVNVLHFCG
jgi:hypothetical protein